MDCNCGFGACRCASGNYGSLAVNSEALFYTSTASGAGANTDLVALKLTNDKQEPVVVVDAIRSAELSANGKKMLVYKGTALHVIDAKPTKVATINDSRVDLTGWTFPIDTRDDFRQIFVDAWRLERDWFYDPGHARRRLQGDAQQVPAARRAHNDARGAE